jgi:hypothetical protein
MASRNQIDTHEYRVSHLATPRGRGTWLFRPATKTARLAIAAGDYSVAVYSAPDSTFTDACKALDSSRCWVVLP